MAVTSCLDSNKQSKPIEVVTAPIQKELHESNDPPFTSLVVMSIRKG